MLLREQHENFLIYSGTAYSLFSILEGGGGGVSDIGVVRVNRQPLRVASR
jgi:hypothetical protein